MNIYAERSLSWSRSHIVIMTSHYPVTTDSSIPSLGNNTSDPVVFITAVTASVTSFVLLLILCGVVLIAILRSRPCKDVPTEESDTQPTPYYENIILPRVTETTYQDQEFELVDNVCYGPLPLSATATRVNANI
jgi:hypothetical protein